VYHPLVAGQYLIRSRNNAIDLVEALIPLVKVVNYASESLLNLSYLDEVGGEEIFSFLGVIWTHWLSLVCRGWESLIHGSRSEVAVDLSVFRGAAPAGYTEPGSGVFYSSHGMGLPEYFILCLNKSTRREQLEGSSSGHNADASE
jgi:hypothetical protein